MFFSFFDLTPSRKVAKTSLFSTLCAFAPWREAYKEFTHKYLMRGYAVFFTHYALRIIHSSPQSSPNFKA
jgi:hypothetical protein